MTTTTAAFINTCHDLNFLELIKLLFASLSFSSPYNCKFGTRWRIFEHSDHLKFKNLIFLKSVQYLLKSRIFCTIISFDQEKQFFPGKCSNCVPDPIVQFSTKSI